MYVSMFNQVHTPREREKQRKGEKERERKREGERERERKKENYHLHKIVHPSVRRE